VVQTRRRLEPARSHNSAFLRNRLPRSKEQRDIFFALARAQDKYHWLEMGSFGAASFAHLTGAGNASLIQQVGTAYEQYKNDKLTQSPYTKQRKLLLDQFSDNTRVFQRFLFNGETASEAIRITQQKALPATNRITSNVAKLNNLSKLAKGGGVLLAGMGGAIACNNIGNTEDRQEKNEIFVEFLGGTAGSGIAGFALAVFFVSSPVGWTAALAIGGASVAAGWAGGKLGKAFYDHKLQSYDLVANTGLDKWCS